MPCATMDDPRPPKHRYIDESAKEAEEPVAGPPAPERPRPVAARETPHTEESR